MLRQIRKLYFLLCSFFLLDLLFVSARDKEITTNEAGRNFMVKNGEKEGVMSVPFEDFGLEYKVLKTGTGTAHPTPSSVIMMHYEGRLIDGTIFDSTYNGEPSTFSIKNENIINGWKGILPRMVEGDKFEAYIPSELAYGATGKQPKIGPGEVLIFIMELIEVRGHSTIGMYCEVTMSSTPNGDFGSLGCNEQEMEYIATTSQWDKDQISKEQLKLRAAGAKKMERETKHWVHRRFHILGQLRSKKFPKKEEL